MKIALHAANDIIRPPIIHYCFLSFLIEMMIETTTKKIRGDQEKKDI